MTFPYGRPTISETNVVRLQGMEWMIPTGETPVPQGSTGGTPVPQLAPGLHAIATFTLTVAPAPAEYLMRFVTLTPTLLSLWSCVTGIRRFRYTPSFRRPRPGAGADPAHSIIGAEL
jgi:hypothetical protein